ncbi:MAG: indole-3-glycerol-phosphate synthase [Candidatus Bathyarchaeia archaeon]
MGSLRSKIFEDMRKHIAYDKQRVDVKRLEKLAEETVRNRKPPNILKTLKSVRDRVPLIAEFKPSSSTRIYHYYYEPVEAVSKMLEGGAAAISVLTEPIYYRGSLYYLFKVSKTFNVPTLRKDLILEEFQIYEAVAAGASSYLLIADQFKDAKRLEDLIQIGRSFGLEPLVEVNSVEDARVVGKTSAKFVGINNGEGVERNLRKTKDLSAEVSADFLVSESGIRNAEDVKFVMQYAHGILVGTAISEAKDIRAKVEELCRATSEKR